MNGTTCICGCDLMKSDFPYSLLMYYMIALNYDYNVKVGHDCCQAVVDEQWTRAMEYINSVSELNYMTQIVIMLYEDPTKV